MVSFPFRRDQEGHILHRRAHDNLSISSAMLLALGLGRPVYSSHSLGLDKAVFQGIHLDFSLIVAGEKYPISLFDQ